jgi:hypothetical protein
MAHRPIGLFATALSLVVSATVTAQRAPQTRTEVARPGGTIAPDGYLYIASRDGGSEGDPLLAGQDLSTLPGKLLRLDVNTPDDDTLPYKIPPTNPFARSSDERLMQLFGITEADFAKIRNNTRREIWAYGVRNPYQFSFDPRNGDLYVADVGQNHWEEIDYQPAASKGGENYGWNKMEVPIVRTTSCSTSTPNGKSKGGFGHPQCINTGNAAALPAVQQ